MKYWTCVHLPYFNLIQEIRYWFTTKRDFKRTEHEK